jgi:Glycosyltransferase 61
MACLHRDAPRRIRYLIALILGVMSVRRIREFGGVGKQSLLSRQEIIQQHEVLRILEVTNHSTLTPSLNAGAGKTASSNDEANTVLVAPINTFTEFASVQPLPGDELTEAKPPEPPLLFEGTKIIPLSPGMDLLENVCLVKGNKRDMNKFISFTRNAEPLKTSVHNSMRPSWSEWTTYTVGHNLSEWDTITQQYPLIRNETLFTIEIWTNPGHCLNDLAFSIALDASHRQLYDNNGKRTIYPQYVASFFKGITGSHGEENESPSWCYSFLHDAGFLDLGKGPVYDDAPGLCFERLLVPLLSVHRFPIDWKDAQARDDLYAGNRADLSGRHPNTGDGNLYPAEALVRLHEQVMKSKNFTNDPWPEIQTQQEDVTVSMYAREGIRRRRWTNADEVKVALERDYRVQVHMVGADWISMSPQQQASLYYNNSRIITVHGAHQANLFYSRNNTRIVEIRCGRADPEAKLSLLEPPPSAVVKPPPSDWYGHLGWFSSSTRRVGIEHFVFAEHTAAHQAVASFNTTNSLLIPFLASRLKLVRRDDNHSDYMAS